MILDVVSHLAELAEPERELRDDAGAKPLEWRPGVTYAYPIWLAEVPIETGPTRRQDFRIAVVRLVEASEEALLERDADVSAAVDALRGHLLAIARHHQVTTRWHHLQAAEIDAPRLAQARGVAVEYAGWRLVN